MSRKRVLRKHKLDRVIVIPGKYREPEKPISDKQRESNLIRAAQNLDDIHDGGTYPNPSIGNAPSPPTVERSVTPDINVMGIEIDPETRERLARTLSSAAATLGQPMVGSLQVPRRERDYAIPAVTSECVYDSWRNHLPAMHEFFMDRGFFVSVMQVNHISLCIQLTNTMHALSTRIWVRDWHLVNVLTLAQRIYANATEVITPYGFLRELERELRREFPGPVEVRSGYL